MPAVNKRELASLLRVSAPTLDRLIERHGDAFPVLQRGDKGREWSFDADAVRAFLAEYEAAQAEAARERTDAVRQAALPIANEDEQKLKPAELLALAKARMIARQEQREAGLLVDTASVRAALGAAFARLNSALHAAVRQVARDHNLPEPVTRAVAAALADAQREFVRSADEFLATEERDLFAARDGTLAA